MKIGILSDIHDNIWNLRAALGGLGEADALICCGDLCSPFVVGLLAEGFPDRPIHLVFGNNDGDLFRITQNASRVAGLELHGELFQGELGGKRVYVNHYPHIARAVAVENYDLICYGHNHLFAIERQGGALLVNPGAIMGYEPGGKREVRATFVVYDTTTGEATAFQVVTDVSGGAIERRVVAFP
jgi:putative phosphoesterase